jgi:hypothetical protein
MLVLTNGGRVFGHPNSDSDSPTGSQARATATSKKRLSFFDFGLLQDTFPELRYVKNLTFPSLQSGFNI